MRRSLGGRRGRPKARIEKLKARLAEVEKAIAEAGQWGAYLTALNEEKKALERSLGEDVSR